MHNENGNSTMAIAVIKQIYNNNVALIELDGYEMVVTGKGITFGKRAGQHMERSRIEKYFVLQEVEGLLEQMPSTRDEQQARLLQLIMRYLGQYSEVQQRIVQLDTFYTILVDHLQHALWRQQQLQRLEPAVVMAAEVRVAYASELHCAQAIIEAVNQAFRVALAEEELVLLTLHLVHAQYPAANWQATLRVNAFLEELLMLLKAALGAYWQGPQWLVERFILHVRALAWRLALVDGKRASVLMEADLLEVMRLHYPQAQPIIAAVQQLVAQRLGTVLWAEEELYLRMHLRRLMSSPREPSCDAQLGENYASQEG